MPSRSPDRPRLPWLVLGLLLLGVVGCTPPAAALDPLDPTFAVEKFIAARQARNLNATMQCFADQPVVRSSLGVSWAGREAVQAIMAYRLTDDYTVQNVQVGGNRVTWSEHVRRGATGGATVNFDEDVEAVVVGGRITSMVTYVGSSRPPLAVAPSPPANDPFLPLSVLLLVAGAVMVWPSAGPRQMIAPANSHLMEGLQAYVARRRSV